MLESESMLPCPRVCVRVLLTAAPGGAGSFFVGLGSARPDRPLSDRTVLVVETALAAALPGTTASPLDRAAAAPADDTEDGGGGAEAVLSLATAEVLSLAAAAVLFGARAPPADGRGLGVALLRPTGFFGAWLDVLT